MMSNTSTEFIKSVLEKYKSGQAKEHAYRPALQKLFSDLTGLNVINDPKRSEYGAPDFVFMKGAIAAAYTEAKDIDVSLAETEKGEQMARYFGYSNLILTNCLEFRFYQNGEKYQTIKIGEINGKDLIFLEDNFVLLEDTIKEFIQKTKEPIKSGVILAKVMAGKARRIRDNIKLFLKEEKNEKNESLLSVYSVIKEILLADLDHDKFADMYAQTVVYGLFVARYHDQTPDTFSRAEARDLIPASNPFLRHFFDHIAGPSFDKRIEFIVNELCEEFVHADIPAIIKNYFNVEKDDSRDPIIHFYEDFLQEYDPEERKKMGVFYTPLPVVRFIVRAIDEILKKEFGLNGLADATKEEMKKESQGKKYKEKVHRVQILDPATGTGTFLNEVIRHIKESFKGQEGRWKNYIKEDLIPRLYGFELMMAPYTIAHLKISSILKESGADIGNERVGLYLTNSLEKSDKEEHTLWDFGLAKAITEESRKANIIKNKIPIMVVLGNPPYSVSSQNKGEWIQDLIKDYKKDLNERKINLDDDYIKFIRFAEYLIEKNGEGVIGMITNNSFIDGVTHRQMRKHLLETFDTIYILDLHGNAKKKETAPDGGPDQNVFNIMQGVSIFLFVKKTKKKKSLGKVYHTELFGKQKEKYDALNNFDFEKMKWKKINYKEPYYFFVPRDAMAEDEYRIGFRVDEIMPVYNSGIQTKNDVLSMRFNEKERDDIVRDFLENSTDALRIKYQLKDTSGWNVKRAKESLEKEYFKTKILYRPFDLRDSLIQKQSGGFIGRSRYDTAKHFLFGNLGLITVRQQSTFNFQHILVTKFMIESGAISLQTKEWGYIFPLYLYADDGTKVTNLKKEIVAEIEKIVGSVTPENILDYIYAVLHSPSYREKFKEFLKIDFPRVPYPKDKRQFFDLAKLGEELRQLHLLESPKVNDFVTTYSVAGDNHIEKGYPIFVEHPKGSSKVPGKEINLEGSGAGDVFINNEQYFGNVSKIAWEFYIGGYQPAQKWLKDRKGRDLSNADIEHYQKIIVTLVETQKIMKCIDKTKIINKVHV